MLKQYVWETMTDEDRSWVLSRGDAGIATTELNDAIGALVADVEQRGDDAVLDALRTHDGVEVDELRVSQAEFDHAASTLNPKVRDAIKVMIGNIRNFNEALLSRRQSWEEEIAPGHFVGERVGPRDSAALFCPSGKASYPSVLAQIATPAVVAGVEKITVIVPPVPGGNGEVDSAVLMVAVELGLTDVFRVNGPAGVAAAAFGTQTIPKHGMVVGPGSPAVSVAQMLVRSRGIDSVLLGPTESAVIADSSADAAIVAADLLNEAEHGEDSTVIFIAWDEAFIAEVDEALEAQVAELPVERAAAATAALGRNGGLIKVANLQQACEVSDWFAPEHCLIAVEELELAASLITHAGELLVGHHTPFSVGNFTLGGPAALPTGGHARSAGGITVETFLKASATGRLTNEALDAVAEATKTLAEHEGFPAHANAVQIRQDK